MELLPYRREEAEAYARYWAYGRNPDFYDYATIGGDCTNFASQCIYAGTGVMNYTPTLAGTTSVPMIRPLPGQVWNISTTFWYGGRSHRGRSVW